MIIRAETEADFPGVAAVNEAAFDNDDEAELIDLVRQTELYVPELSFIAVDEGKVVGHVMFSYVTLEAAHGDLPVLDLAPLAVLPARQREGIGSALTRHGLELIDRRGEPLVLVEGIPAYYPRFGFERASLHGIHPPSPQIPDAAFMVKLLSNFDHGYRGQVRYPPAFYASGAA